MVKELSVVGKSLPLEDAYGKVTGRLKFAGDVKIGGMLHAKVLRSPYPHAKIVKIDTNKAQALNGVEAIITHEDVPKEEWIAVSVSYRTRVLDERVRFVGDEVAAVAAINTEVAEEALNLIEVEYKELPHVFDVEEAMKPGAPQVCPHGNVRTPSIVEWGDIEKGFKEADLVVEHKTKMGTQQHAPLDRNACIANWEGARLTMWTGTQTPFQIRDEISRLLKMPQNMVRVIQLPLGGSFGLWWSNRFHLIPVFLARKARKPVRLELTREEVFATVKRRETPVSWAKLGVKKDGSFTAIQFKHYFDNGAYGFKSDPYYNTCDLWGGKTPHGRFEMYGVSTNLVTGGCMRGVGDVTVTFCMEQVIDVAAEKLGIDPVEIRLKNQISTGEPVRKKFITLFPIRYGRALEPQDLPPKVLSSCGLDKCIRQGAELIGWEAKWKGWGQPVAVNGSKRRGLGMAVSQRTSGVAGFGAPGAIIKANQDGSFNLLTGAACIGQGIETTQAQIAAEELGVPVDSVIGIHGDTGVCPWCIPTTASSGAHLLGLATKAAAADAKRQLCELASKALAAEPEDLDIKNGIIYIIEQPEKGIPIACVTGGASPPNVLAPPTITGRAWGALPYSPQASPFLAHFVEVEVDTETGEVKILRYVAVHDSGRIINPEVCENQVAGGVIQGCGLGLTENLVFDERNGQVLNPDYVDYKTLGVLDMPDVEIRFVEVTDPVGAFGVKGLGEAPHACPPAAIAQAIHNATGIRHNYVPITPEKLLAAWKAQSTKEIFRSDG